MMTWQSHLIVMPIVLPLVTAAVLLLFALVNLLRDLHGLLAQSSYGTAYLSGGLNILLDRNHTCGRCAQIYHFEVCHVYLYILATFDAPDSNVEPA